MTHPRFLALAALLVLGAPVVPPVGHADGGPPGSQTISDATVAHGSLWIGVMTFRSLGRAPVWRIERRDETSGRLMARIPTPSPAWRFATDARWVWVASGGLRRIDPRTNHLSGPLGRPGEIDFLGMVAAGPEGVFAGDEVADRIFAIDPPTGRPMGGWFRPSRRRPLAMAVGESSLWITSWGPRVNGQPSWRRGPGTLMRIDPRTRRTTATIPVGRWPDDLAVGAGSVWVANAGDGTVSRIDPATNRVVGTTVVTGRPRPFPPGLRIAVSAQGVFVSGVGGAARINPITGRLVGPPIAPYAGGPSGLTVAAGPRSAWLLLQGTHQALRRRIAPP